jgi:menaquinone-dependent protoporphyrinogen oxidase
MNPILVVYTTREGQTRRIAEHIAAKLKRQGLSVNLLEGGHAPAGLFLGGYSAVILAASVHQGKHESEMVRFVRDRRTELQQLPTALLSVSLSQAGAQDTSAPLDRRSQAAADVKRMITAFLVETGWNPTRAVPVAGALMYSKYNFFLRAIMKRIARQAGASTDTTKDHEFTDWATLDRAVTDFIAAELGGEDTRIPA